MNRHRVLLIAALAVAFVTDQVCAADRHVPDQYATVAAALDAAQPGDRVVVAPGVYQEHDLDLSAGITLVGEPEAPASVVIDAEGQGRVLRAENLDQPVAVEGLTLTGGHAGGDNPYDDSGGGLFISCAEVRMENVIVRGNRADGSGGGLRVAHGEVVGLGCELSGNTAGKGGGGLDASYDATVELVDLTCLDNAAAWGGGLTVRVGARLTVVRGRLERNHALVEPGLGGALACDHGAAPSLQLCVLADNEALHGGAVYAADGAEPHLFQATVDRNVVAGSGAAVYLKNADALIDRTIVSFHDQGAFHLSGESMPRVSVSDIYGNAGGDWVGPLASQLNEKGNFCDDPLYCSFNDRHLEESSPCAPAGNDSGLVGALGVGCAGITDTPPALQPLVLRAQPNPFNPRTEVVYSVPRDGHVRLSVFDLRGRRLAVLADRAEAAGEHRVPWEARDERGRALASGTYLLVLETGERRLTSKIMLVR